MRVIFVQLTKLASQKEFWKQSESIRETKIRQLIR